MTKNAYFEFARHFGAPAFSARIRSRRARARAAHTHTRARDKDGGDGGGNGVICWSSSAKPE